MAQPRVGVAVVILNQEGKVVLGKRKGSHGAGTWACPGGHLEFGESLETCAEREVLEETGLAIRDVRFLTVTNDVFEVEKKHYITVFVGAVLQDEEAQPQILEPEKCEEWRWTAWEEVRSWYDRQAQAKGNGSSAGPTLFIPLLNLFRQRPAFNPSQSYASAHK
ncbi:nucleotide triphosphate diphosphatase NUDT15 [Aspergillus clavatus NRRL 1]|uniref:NUDIX domain, putative n=1 Tax=Aspergillus clavatus (strain ATCC 1007 / CBS 513.65 / DSM 816 / NCTC 3887 / NRRL 1 / QM 1276 / 107) TaxID=344612 RepID=A1CBX2_ASPCL|nr:NUDIX domain, putative [Aspergillus clavatus NRRL 1]EAW13240.1 NUDIX domain, putative [Aspergillus clavatus NRRL 1]